MNARAVLIAILLALGALVVWFASTTAATRTREAASTDGVDRTISAAPEVLSDSARPRENSESNASRRSTAERRGIDVIVLNALTRAPLEDFDAELSEAGAVLDQATSDRAGTAHLSSPPENGAWLSIAAPDGWNVDQRVRRVQPTADGRAQVIEVLARESGRARVRARLVDDATFEPVPFYMVQIGAADGSHESVVSDAEGRFVSAQTYGECTLELLCLDVVEPEVGMNERRVDHTVSVNHVPRDDETDELELAIPVGPTYHLTLEGPDDVRAGPLFATLRWMHVDISPPRQVTETHVRRTPREWVRFRPERRMLPNSDYPVALVIASKDGRWNGESKIDPTLSVSDVTVRLEARAGVMVRVLDPAREPIANARVSIAPHRGLGAAPPIDEQLSSGNGLAEFTLLAPGFYQAEALSPAHERNSVRFELTADERTDVELILNDARLDGEISGRVELEPTHNASSVRLTLYSRRPEGRRFEMDIPLVARDEGPRGTFVFRGVPPGDYALSARTPNFDMLEPKRAMVSTGARDIVFRSPARSPEPQVSTELEFRLFDALDGKPLDRTFLRSLHPDDEDWGELRLRSRPLTWSIERVFDPLERWIVGAPGHRSVEIDLSSAREEDGVRVVEVRLARGFSFELECIGPGFRPLAGVRVLFDGSAVGETDATGRAKLEHATAPQRIELEYQGWMLEPSSREALAAVADGSAGFAFVILSPR